MQEFAGYGLSWSGAAVFQLEICSKLLNGFYKTRILVFLDGEPFGNTSEGAC